MVFFLTKLTYTYHSKLSSNKKSSFNTITMTATAWTSYLTVFAILATGSNVRKSTSPIPAIFTTWQVKLCISSVEEKKKPVTRELKLRTLYDTRSRVRLARPAFSPRLRTVKGFGLCSLLHLWADSVSFYLSS